MSASQDKVLPAVEAGSHTSTARGGSGATTLADAELDKLARAVISASAMARAGNAEEELAEALDRLTKWVQGSVGNGAERRSFTTGVDADADAEADCAGADAGAGDAGAGAPVAAAAVDAAVDAGDAAAVTSDDVGDGPHPGGASAVSPDGESFVASRNERIAALVKQNGGTFVAQLVGIIESDMCSSSPMVSESLFKLLASITRASTWEAGVHVALLEARVVTKLAEHTDAKNVDTAKLVACVLEGLAMAGAARLEYKHEVHKMLDYIYNLMNQHCCEWMRDCKLAVLCCKCIAYVITGHTRYQGRVWDVVVEKAEVDPGVDPEYNKLVRLRKNISRSKLPLELHLILKRVLAFAVSQCIDRPEPGTNDIPIVDLIDVLVWCLRALYMLAYDNHGIRSVLLKDNVVPLVMEALTVGGERRPSGQAEQPERYYRLGPVACNGILLLQELAKHDTAQLLHCIPLVRDNSVHQLAIQYLKDYGVESQSTERLLLTKCALSLLACTVRVGDKPGRKISHDYRRGLQWQIFTNTIGDLMKVMALYEDDDDQQVTELALEYLCVALESSSGEAIVKALLNEHGMLSVVVQLAQVRFERPYRHVLRKALILIALLARNGGEHFKKILMPQPSQQVLASTAIAAAAASPAPGTPRRRRRLGILQRQKQAPGTENGVPSSCAGGRVHDDVGISPVGESLAHILAKSIREASSPDDRELYVLIEAYCAVKEVAKHGHAIKKALFKYGTHQTLLDEVCGIKHSDTDAGLVKHATNALKVLGSSDSRRIVDAMLHEAMEERRQEVCRRNSSSSLSSQEQDYDPDRHPQHVCWMVKELSADTNQQVDGRTFLSRAVLDGDGDRAMVGAILTGDVVASDIEQVLQQALRKAEVPGKRSATQPIISQLLAYRQKHAFDKTTVNFRGLLNCNPHSTWLESILDSSSNLIQFADRKRELGAELLKKHSEITRPDITQLEVRGRTGTRPPCPLQHGYMAGHFAVPEGIEEESGASDAFDSGASRPASRASNADTSDASGAQPYATAANAGRRYSRPARRGGVVRDMSERYRDAHRFDPSCSARSPLPPADPLPHNFLYRDESLCGVLSGVDKLPVADTAWYQRKHEARTPRQSQTDSIDPSTQPSGVTAVQIHGPEGGAEAGVARPPPATSSAESLPGVERSADRTRGPPSVRKQAGQRGSPGTSSKPVRVDLSDNHITSLENILSLHDTTATALILQNNDLKDLPRRLKGTFPKLRLLDASGNCMEQIPSALVHLTSLTHADLSYCGISRATPMFDCYSVQAYGDNEMFESDFEQAATMPQTAGAPGATAAESRPGSTSSSALSPLRSPQSINSDDQHPERCRLKELDLRGNHLSALPVDFHQAFRSLKKLCLQKCKFSSLPSRGLGAMPYLQELDLGSNELEALDDSISNLGSLEKLILKSNRISVLPSSDCASKLHRLAHIDLGRNRLGTNTAGTWDFVRHLPHVKTILLSSNELTGTIPAPADWASKVVSKLALDNNQFDVWDLSNGAQHWTQLIWVSLKNNQLSHVPKEIGSLRHLQELFLSGNNGIRELPSDMQYLDDLLIFPWADLQLEPPLPTERTAKSMKRYLREANTDARTFSNVRLVINATSDQVKGPFLEHLDTRKKPRKGEHNEQEGDSIHQDDISAKSLSSRSKASPPVRKVITICEEDAGGEEVTIECWDFHSDSKDHKALQDGFLARRSAYLAMFNASKPDDVLRLRPWLQTVAESSPGCPVVLVGIPEKSARAEGTRVRENVERLRRILPDGLVHAYNVDTILQRRLLGNPWADVLKTVVESRAASAALHAKVQSFCHDLRDEIMLVRQSRSWRDCMVVDTKRVREIAERVRRKTSGLEGRGHSDTEQHGVTQPVGTAEEADELSRQAERDKEQADNELHMALQFLEEVGIVMHLPDSHLGLHAYYCLHPARLCNWIAVHALGEMSMGNSEVDRQRAGYSLQTMDCLDGDHGAASLVRQLMHLLEQLCMALPLRGIRAGTTDTRASSGGVGQSPMLFIPSNLPSHGTDRNLKGNGKVVRYLLLPSMSHALVTRLLAHLLQFARVFDKLDGTVGNPKLWKTGISVKWPHKILFKVECCRYSAEKDNTDWPDVDASVRDYRQDMIRVEVEYRSPLPGAPPPAACMPYQHMFCYLMETILAMLDEWRMPLTYWQLDKPERLQYAVCPQCSGHGRIAWPLDVITARSAESPWCCSRKHPEACFLPRDLAPELDESWRCGVQDLSGSKRLVQVKRLGGGGFGEVSRDKMRDENTGVDVIVATKKFLSCLGSSAEENLRDELRIVAELRHPSIVSVHGFHQSDAGQKLVMEIAEHGALNDLLAKKRVHSSLLQVDFVHKVALQVALGLECMHGKCIAFRDMKPHNILIRSLDISTERVAVLTDFGISQWCGPAGLSKLTGTAGYRPPEMISSATGTLHYDEKADIFCFGLVLCELATGGKRPFLPGANHIMREKDMLEVYGASRETQAARLHEVLSDLLYWPAMYNLVKQCLQESPEQRPTAGELVRLLQHADFACIRGRATLPRDHKSPLVVLGMDAFEQPVSGAPQAWACVGREDGREDGSDVQLYSFDLSKPGLGREVRTMRDQTPALSGHIVLAEIGSQHFIITGARGGTVCIIRSKDHSVRVRKLAASATITSLLYVSAKPQPADSTAATVGVLLVGLSNGTLARIDGKDILSAWGTERFECPFKTILVPLESPEAAHRDRPVSTMVKHAGSGTAWLVCDHSVFVYDTSTAPPLSECTPVNISGDYQYDGVAVSGEYVFTTVIGKPLIQAWLCTDPLSGTVKHRVEFSVSHLLGKPPLPGNFTRQAATASPVDYGCVYRILAQGRTLWVAVSDCAPSTAAGNSNSVVAVVNVADLGTPVIEAVTQCHNKAVSSMVLTNLPVHRVPKDKQPHRCQARNEEYSSSDQEPGASSNQSGGQPSGESLAPCIVTAGLSHNLTEPATSQAVEAGHARTASTVYTRDIGGAVQQSQVLLWDGSFGRVQRRLDRDAAANRQAALAPAYTQASQEHLLGSPLSIR
ncbi:uncharacterized protein LOC135818515 [Sycon ciliatum]|uniref:uncharacterized protein LOC135818515 n=1 Tax=Sycon ciliatum TaxID=27933 RepID=UPI0031F638D2